MAACVASGITTTGAATTGTTTGAGAATTGATLASCEVPMRIGCKTLNSDHPPSAKPNVPTSSQAAPALPMPPAGGGKGRASSRRAGKCAGSGVISATGLGAASGLAAITSTRMGAGDERATC